MIFEVKQDGHRKARLVAGGHLVDPMGISSRFTVVKGRSFARFDRPQGESTNPVR